MLGSRVRCFCTSVVTGAMLCCMLLVCTLLLVCPTAWQALFVIAVFVLSCLLHVSAPPKLAVPHWKRLGSVASDSALLLLFASMPLQVVQHFCCCDLQCVLCQALRLACELHVLLYQHCCVCSLSAVFGSCLWLSDCCVVLWPGCTGKCLFVQRFCSDSILCFGS